MRRSGPPTRRTPLPRGGPPRRKSSTFPSRREASFFRKTWKGDPPELRQGKRLVRVRSGGLCEVSTPACPDGAHWARVVHHVVSRERGRGWPRLHHPTNLLHVCPDGHEWIHAHPAAAGENGWLKSRPKETE